jgi:acetyl esterase/lipase
MRLVRSYANEWKIDTNRLSIPVSASGEVVDDLAFSSGNGNPAATDPIDRLNGRPDFIIQVYPGPLFIPDMVPANAPPAFLITGNEDTCCSSTVTSLLEKYRAARGTVEAHILARADHAFNMGYRSSLQSVKNWPRLLAYWLQDGKLISTVPPELK